MQMYIFIDYIHTYGHTSRYILYLCPYIYLSIWKHQLRNLFCFKLWNACHYPLTFMRIHSEQNTGNIRMEGMESLWFRRMQSSGHWFILLEFGSLHSTVPWPQVFLNPAPNTKQSQPSLAMGELCLLEAMVGLLMFCSHHCLPFEETF